MIELRRIATAFVLATIALIVLLGARPIRVETILAGYAVTVAAIALTGLTAAITAARELTPSRFERELTRERILPTRPPELVRVEREITLARSNPDHLHRRLRPLLRDIAEARLDLSLARSPQRAREALGDEAWELLRPDAPPPDERTAAGVTLPRLRRIIDRLEAL